MSHRDNPTFSFQRTQGKVKGVAWVGIPPLPILITRLWRRIMSMLLGIQNWKFRICNIIRLHKLVMSVGRDGIPWVLIYEYAIEEYLCSGYAIGKNSEIWVNDAPYWKSVFELRKHFLKFPACFWTLFHVFDQCHLRMFSFDYSEKQLFHGAHQNDVGRICGLVTHKQVAKRKALTQ